MDLSTFQLVDAINDMDMLRNLSDQEQYTKPQQSQQQQPQPQPQQQQQAYQQLHGDIDLLFESDHHSSDNQFMNQQHQEASMLTPLISPAMTPSFNYHHHHQKFHNPSDMDFSPLSSPAIMPQMDQSRYHQKPIYQEQQQQQQQQQQRQYTTDRQDSFENLSANQICEQYEQLEQAKLLITQKLSELQKTQRQHYTGSSPSSSSPSSGVYSKHALIHSTAMLDNNSRQMSTPNSPSQSPHLEPATPASLMNMKLSNAQPSKLQFSSSTSNHISRPTSNQALNFYSGNSNSTPASFASSSTSSSSNSNHIFQSPILTSTPNNHDTIMSPMITPPSSKNASKSKAPPPSPLALTPRQSTRNNIPKEKSLRPSSKKQRRESSSTDQSKSNSTIHASPRALKPLLISPTLNPGLKPLPSALLPSSSASHNNRVSSVEDAERILATRSNYQNLMEGKGAALGIAFSTQIKSGLEVRRTAHKAAEQKRRDSLKEWFDRLRREVEDGYVKRQKTLMSRVMKAQELEKNTSNKQQQRGEDDDMTEAAAEEESTDLKPLSKVLLLQYAYEYIASLKNSLQERDVTIEKLKQGCNDTGDGEKAAGLKRKSGPDEDAASTSDSTANDSTAVEGEI
ncbi:hypothetical protein MAM1_0104d05349 [Mucor ambiguus]|uniref:BHLH domain-containing protein n=1 Tax=Mucor ambiguus TaxID=91626 RepID=A0A0C9MUV6_9FUNG|nr:hypothetical protein MAM1_0104d05349 [Mucor ambiguus]